MKKVLSLILCISWGVCACATNGLECDENTFEDHCYSDTVQEICTLGERALFKCPDGWSCDSDKGACVED